MRESKPDCPDESMSSAQGPRKCACDGENLDLADDASENVAVAAGQLAWKTEVGDTRPMPKSMCRTSKRERVGGKVGWKRASKRAGKQECKWVDKRVSGLGREMLRESEALRGQ